MRHVGGLADPADRDVGGRLFWNSSKSMPIRAAVAAVMSVAMKPGATALAVMPNLPSSMARVLVNPCIPALAAE